MPSLGVHSPWIVLGPAYDIMVDVRISSIAEHLFGKSTQPFKSKIFTYQNVSLFFAPRELESIVQKIYRQFLCNDITLSKAIYSF